jgi:hypothetical protein
LTPSVQDVNPTLRSRVSLAEAEAEAEEAEEAEAAATETAAPLRSVAAV